MAVTHGSSMAASVSAGGAGAGEAAGANGAISAGGSSPVTRAATAVGGERGQQDALAVVAGGQHQAVGAFDRGRPTMGALSGEPGRRPAVASPSSSSVMPGTTRWASRSSS